MQYGISEDQFVCVCFCGYLCVMNWVGWGERNFSGSSWRLVELLPSRFLSQYTDAFCNMRKHPAKVSISPSFSMAPPLASRYTHRSKNLPCFQSITLPSISHNNTALNFLCSLSSSACKQIYSHICLFLCQGEHLYLVLLILCGLAPFTFSEALLC